MQDVKITLIHDDLLTTPCSIAFLKHIVGMTSSPEHFIDARMNGKLSALFSDKEQEQERYLTIDTTGVFPFPRLCIINFQDEDLPFKYPSVESYARRIIRFAHKADYVTSVATPVHGPGSGLDASEAMETMLSSFARELQLRESFGSLREIIFVEKDRSIFERLEERLEYLLQRGKAIVREGHDIFLNPERTKASDEDHQERIARLAQKHLFVAMPYAKEFNNVYYAIKISVENHKRKCERVDQDEFTGDIVKRIKERIASAELVIADLTGNNPNVFYEVGYASGIGKDIVLISQKQEIPFDLQSERKIFYDPQDIFGLASQLESLLDALLP